MEKYYRIADIGIKVQVQEKDICPSEGVLENFLSEVCSCKYEMEMEVVDSIPSPKGVLIQCAQARAIYQEGDSIYQYFGVIDRDWTKGYQCLCKKGNWSKLWVKKSYVPMGISSKTILNALELEDLVIKEGGFILHASYISIDGEAILFTAPSGTGKSTQAELWCNLRGAELINGDRAIVKKAENRFYACGVPFSGSSGVRKNKTLPLKAIVYLKQVAVNRARQLTGLQTFQKVWEECSMRRWDREEIESCMGIVLDATSSVPVYELACTPDFHAIEALEAAIRGGAV